MNNKTVTVTHAADRDIFVPSGAELGGINFPEPLQLPYLDVRESVNRTHESVRGMWGAVFVFAVECRRRENQDAVKQICDQHNVTAKVSSSPFNPAVKIAIGSPRFDEALSKIVFDYDDSQINRFCRVFDFAYAHLKNPTKDNFLSWLDDVSPKGGGGSISECLVRAIEWANKGKFSSGKLDDSIVFGIKLEKLRAANRVSYDGLFAKSKDASSFGLEDGKHYSMMITLEDGAPVVDVVAELDSETFKNAINAKLPILADDEKPLTIVQFLKAIGKHENAVEILNVEVAGDVATISGTKKDGPISQIHKLYPGIGDVVFSLTASVLAEIKRCIPVFKEGACRWSLEKNSITISLPEKHTAKKLEQVYNAGRKRKVALDVEIVKYLDGGKTVSIFFKPTGVDIRS